MKIIAVGDTHGRDAWKKVVDREPDFDQFVFIGDYWDSYIESYLMQLHNFREIMQFKRDNPDKVKCLIGNHDFHYMPLALSFGEYYSGFQNAHAFEISNMLGENMDILDMCFKHEDWLFTHAGVSHAWLEKVGFDESDLGIEEFINLTFHYQPRHFCFDGHDPYGDDIKQSPIWIRPHSLMRNAYNFETIKQVVGHTANKQIKIQKNRFFFIDSMPFEYLVIQDGAPEVREI